MDKLQPIIKHRFWILFGLTLPIALYAYYSANGSLKAAAQERESSITSTLQGISSGQEPNPTFAEGLERINEVQEARVKAEIRRLWERQQDRMTWPAAIASKVPAEYRGEFGLQAGVQYKSLYPVLIEDVYEYAQPVPMGDEEASWKPKVIMSPAVIPRHTFGRLNVSSDDIWDAQEDTWFLRVLLEAVRDMNADADTVVTSVIRRIDRLELLGGTGESSVVAAASGGGEGGYGDDYGMMAGGEMGEEYGDMEGGGGFGAAKGSVSFDPAEELGSQIDASAAATGGGEADSYGGAGEGMAGVMGAMGGGAQQNLLRYVAYDETAPFQERGFYMSVIIDETKIPEFLVRLSNSEWPIRLLRFHMGPNPYATAAGRQMVDSGAIGGFGEYGEYGGEMEEAYDDESYESPIGPMAIGGEYGGMPGGYGEFGGAARGGTPSFKGKNAQLAGALSHPNLVQVDLCGVITMYKPPAEDVMETSEGADAATATSQPESADTGETDPTALEEAATDGTAGEEPAEPAGETEAADATEPPAATDETSPESPADPAVPEAVEETETDAAPGAPVEE
ncbi:hypothetical protein Mal4_04610 [Maioricimonas rarisocia]|uniref:Uncharacterized protein n=1 Tax=Maioricimonas rarisocia TaxID=2528026 RepID=A0A517Z116_9PLAN|nr:hypothetical protein [Maioricimonas rarisocia]QDU36177.1 hypothetical protein Mal4_04610 [Maioricimonas rarisocia]